MTKSSVGRYHSPTPAKGLLTTTAVFVHWIPMLSILGRMLFQDGFKFVYLWGEMETRQQERSIKAFQKVPEIKIMVRFC